MPVGKDVKLAADVNIWHPELSNLYGCTIGTGTSIGAFCEIRKDVVIGAMCKLQSHIFIPEGVVIMDRVFIGPHVCFTNDKYPRAVGNWELLRTVVKSEASIGANVTILPGVTIGSGACIGAGSVVTKDVPDNEIWVGNPARKHG